MTLEQWRQTEVPTHPNTFGSYFHPYRRVVSYTRGFYTPSCGDYVPGTRLLPIMDQREVAEYRGDRRNLADVITPDHFASRRPDLKIKDDILNGMNINIIHPSHILQYIGAGVIPLGYMDYSGVQRQTEEFHLVSMYVDGANKVIKYRTGHREIPYQEALDAVNAIQSSLWHLYNKGYGGIPAIGLPLYKILTIRQHHEALCPSYNDHNFLKGPVKLIRIAEFAKNLCYTACRCLFNEKVRRTI